MTKLLRWLAAIWPWLFDKWLVWGGGFAIVVSVLLPFHVGTEPAFRLTGLALQLIGAITVAWNIRDTQERTRRPGIFVSLRQWWRRRPRLRGNSVSLVAAMGSASTAGATAHGFGWAGVDPGTSLEARLATAEKNLTRVRDQLNTLEVSTERILKQQALRIDQEVRILLDSDTKLRDEMRDIAASGLHLALAGVMLLILGLIMSTTSIELAALVHPLK